MNKNKNYTLSYLSFINNWILDSLELCFNFFIQFGINWVLYRICFAICLDRWKSSWKNGKVPKIKYLQEGQNFQKDLRSSIMMENLSEG